MNSMIVRNVVIALACIACVGCTDRSGSADDRRPRQPDIPDTASAQRPSPPPARDTAADSAAARPSAFELNPVIPGERIGKIVVGEDIESVTRALGPSDSSDAAMGHAWQFWFSKGSAGGDRHHLGVYSVLNDSATHHEVREILATSPRFVTAEGIGAGSSLEAILKAFPGVRMTGEYRRGHAKALRVYDHPERGIAFVVEPGRQAGSGRAVAVIVHRIGDEAGREYIPL